MLEEVNRLTSLIDNLLTISRADSGHIHLNCVVVPVVDLAREAAGLLEVLMEEKSLRLVRDGGDRVGPEGAADVSGDRLFLRQALVNILHNAVKYSPTDGTITLRARRDGAQAVRFSVKDEGPGIPAALHRRIFDKFFRISETNSDEGAGLGLSIAREIVLAHSGTIGVESEPSKGSEFFFTLPGVV